MPPFTLISANDLRTLRTSAELCVRAAARRPGVETAKWLVSRMQQLGPTYIKAGQFASQRKDLLGKDVTTALSSLRDRINPLPFGDIEAVLQSEGILAKLDSIETTPLASASIAQVHRAVLDGVQVVVKVRRPGISAYVRSDVAFLRSLARVVRPAWVGVVDEFECRLLEEMNFATELVNGQEFFAMYEGDPTVVIPRMIPGACTDRVLTMEYRPSTSLFGVTGTPARRAKLAALLMDTFMTQLLYSPVVHGDPHAGNVGVDSDGRLVLYDFGSVIQISRGYRVQLKIMISVLVGGRPAQMVRALKLLGLRVIDDKLAETYMAMYYKYVRTIDLEVFRPRSPPSETVASASTAPFDATRIPFELDETLLRLVRVFGMLEGVCKELDGSFDYFRLMPSFWDAFLLDADFMAARASWDIQSLDDFDEP
jgi:predicted unusual protein kinase regulating ubiquinone biosynthesis (AarF/ABC1/UbiB family)